MLENPNLQMPGNIRDYIRSTAGWTRFLSILGFIGVGFMFIFAIIITIGLSFFRNYAHGNTAPPFFGLIYMLEIPLVLIPSVYLFKYSGALKNILAGYMDAQTIENAVRYQKSYWKFVSILVLAGLILGMLGILIAIMVPLMKSL